MIKNKYQIERRYIDVRHNVRPGTRLTSGTPGFLVAHDTGNPGATADNHFDYFQTLKDRSASAQVFIDDKKILEIIPTGTGADPEEKAWHVLYNVSTDNDRFGDDANDIALGVDLCYGGEIDFAAAYDRFVWYLAYCCDKWGLNPLTHIPSHKQLDPARKRDCNQALAMAGKTLKDLLYDVATEIKDSRP
ncbi:peptidoglycan recognition protein family protein [Paenibacillus apii]|uniref:peptidoglycan recognition protein family protein n=1 Tax=Paenibacillus apii TaxID=1850370 RepID=UPI001F1B7535|nr:peptidoglycan recognition family protein [Paenibacillus apii]